MSKTTFNTVSKNYPQAEKNPQKRKKEYGTVVYPEDCHIELPNLGVQDKNMNRFKLSSIKDKSTLFEVSYLQIGCKTQLFYDVKSSKNYLKIDLFFGNKTNEPLTDFEVEYIGRESTLCSIL